MSRQTSSSAATCGWRWLRYVIATVLFIGAGAKIANWIQIVAGSGLLANRMLLLGVIGLESAVATYLCLASKINSWRLAVVTFTILACAASYALATGQDCNCIVQAVKPQFMLSLDLGILALAVWYRPSSPYSTHDTHSLANLAVCFMIGGLFVAGAMFREYTAAQQPHASDGPVEFLIADILVNKPWPLNSRFYPRLESLETGKWIVVIVRRDCTHCEKLIADYFSSSAKTRGRRTAVFVAGAAQWAFQFDRVAMDVDDRFSIHWPHDEPFVPTPAVFLLEDGRVIEAADGDESDEFCRSILATL